MKKQFTRPDSELVDKMILEKSLTTLMNDKKWVRLIGILVQNHDLIKECRVKLVWEDNYNNRTLRIGDAVSYEFDYYSNSMEAMISGYPKGFYYYKEVEWLDFPSVVIKKGNEKRSSVVKQNLLKIQEIIASIGLFEIALDEENLRLYAYMLSSSVICVLP